MVDGILVEVDQVDVGRGESPAFAVFGIGGQRAQRLHPEVGDGASIALCQHAGGIGDSGTDVRCARDLGGDDVDVQDRTHWHLGPRCRFQIDVPGQCPVPQ